jgi:CysZ protein
MFVRALLLSLQSLSDGKIVKIIFKTLAITIAIFLTFGVAAWFTLPLLLGRWALGDDGLLAIGAFAAMLLAGWLLWRVIAIAVLWFFADDIIDAVEARYYPLQAQNGKRPGGVQSAQLALGSVGRAVGYNLLALPVYAVLLITGVGTGLAFLLVNGLLLGRDLQDMLTARHGAQQVQFGKLSRLSLGAGGTAAMLLPFVNLLVPVVATAMAVHMAHLNNRLPIAVPPSPV